MIKLEQTPEPKQTPKLITNKQFRKQKRKLIELEKQNYNQIVLIPRSGEKSKDNNWYEIAEHSALIYYYAVIQPLKEEVKFAEDANSFYEHYETGFICTNGENKVRLLLQKSGLYQTETQKDGYHIFQLNKTFQKSEITKFKTLEESRRKASNTIIDIAFTDPELFRDLKNLSRELHRICGNFGKLNLLTNGARITTLSDSILNNYQLLSITKTPKPFWLAIYKDLRKLAIEIQTAIHIGLIDLSDGTKLTTIIKPSYQKITKIINSLISSRS